MQDLARGKERFILNEGIYSLEQPSFVTILILNLGFSTVFVKLFGFPSQYGSICYMPDSHNVLIIRYSFQTSEIFAVK